MLKKKFSPKNRYFGNNNFAFKKRVTYYLNGPLNKKTKKKIKSGDKHLV